MNEITNVALENEMDLILAHKQSMRLGELTGLSLSAQTTFATAVSEVSRAAISTGKNASLILYVSGKAEKIKFIIAALEDNNGKTSIQKDEGYKYAKRLVSNINTTTLNNVNRTELSYRLPPTTRIDDAMVEKWRINLNTDPAVSPYEEIKRKNRQLVEMADKLRESEQQYKTLTDSLPIMIFTRDEEGNITYASRWLQEYTGETIEQLNGNRWQNIIHPDDAHSVLKDWNNRFYDPAPIVIPERRLKSAAGEYRWHTGISTAIVDDDVSVKCRNTYLVDINAQKLVEETLKDNDELKQMGADLEEKVRLLNQSNQQLEQFAYVASHDLQEPLRKIGFYSDFLQKKYGAAFPAEATQFFNNLVNATGRMKELIQDILAYSTVRKDAFVTTSLNDISAEVQQDLDLSIQEKNATLTIGDLPDIEGNPRQLKQLFENLVSNSLKFSKEGVATRISISAEKQEGNVLLSFTDNGIGFEDAYMNKMFTLFQRLHARDQYAGTGIGLAICKKIVELHNGSITASGIPGEGAVFLVTLPLLQK